MVAQNDEKSSHLSLEREREMQNCLGIYVEEKIIKYAKVSKDRENIKIESFGTKTYEDITQTINQIIQETNSAKTPISVNLTGEYYDYFDLFSLLNKKDLKNSTEIEFEMLCKEKNIRKEDMEARYIFVIDQSQENRMKAINVSIEKDRIQDRKDLFSGYNLSVMEPLPICVTSLARLGEADSELVINMEELTTLTFIQKGQIDKIETIDTSITEALMQIAKKENSISKGYEILKNTTIVAQDMEVATSGNEYIDTVTQILSRMLAEIKEKISEYGRQVNKIYFSGTGIVVNNVDMYFQDRLNDIECNVIRPSFLEAQSLKVGIKDYIEVNSAIALALSGTTKGTSDELNFVEKKMLSGGLDITGIPGGAKMPNAKEFKESMQAELEPSERMIMRILAMCLVFVIAYSTLASTLFKNLERQEEEAVKKQEETSIAIQNMSKNKSSIDSFTSEYQSVISKLNNQSVANGEVLFYELEIPNFLQTIASIIPAEVKLKSIENTTGRHFVIQARSIKYQQLGYFKALLETTGGLENVSASTGIREYEEVESDIAGEKKGTLEEFIVVTIEGDLKK